MKKVTVSVVIIVIVIVAAQAAPAIVPAALPTGQAAPAGAPAVGPLAAVALMLSLGGDSPQPCSMKGACSMTPTPQMRIAIVIDDDAGWLSIVGETLKASGFTVRTCLTFCDDPAATVFVVDAQDAAEQIVGDEFVRLLRASHPTGFIIGMSSALNQDFGGTETIQARFMLAGADMVWDKAATLKVLKSLLPQ